MIVNHYIKLGTCALLALVTPQLSGNIAVAQMQHVESAQSLLVQAERKTAEKAWPDAAAAWERVVERNPVNGDYWFSLGEARFQSKRYLEAVDAFRRALDLRVGFPFDTAYRIAACYAASGDRASALSWIEKSLALGLRDVAALETDPSFAGLRGDPKFRELAGLVDVGAMSRVDGWRCDLRFMARELRRLHYTHMREVAPGTFDAAVAKLDEAIPRLSDDQITVELMRLIAMAGDGHTHLMVEKEYPSVPVRFFAFVEGVYVLSAAPEHADLVGSRVVAVGGRPVEDVLAALDPIISKENAMWARFYGPYYLAYPRLLNGLGIVARDDSEVLTLRGEDGVERTVTLQAGRSAPTPEWVRANSGSSNPLPLTLKNRDAAYWFEYLPERRTVFFQFNAVKSEESEPLDRFVARLFAFIDTNPVERLVIDLRWNSGGDNTLLGPLLAGLVKCDKVNRKGGLFVVVGRRTYSAAMCASALIERFTNAIFVGEPTGSSPNFVGESIPFVLPYSKLRGTISDLYWQNSVATDYRTWIAPTLYAPPTFASFRENRDPAMDAIFEYVSNDVK